MPKVPRTRKNIIHAVADCENCKFVAGYFLTAVQLGREHAKKTGHKVTVETGNTWIYNPDKDDN